MFNQESRVFSWLKSPIRNTIPSGVLSLFEVYRWIVGEGSNNQLRTLTEELRSIQDEKERKRFKGDRLPFVLFGGEFNQRSIKGLKTPSGVVIVDIDGEEDGVIQLTPDDIEPLKTKMSEDKELSPLLLFRSPSGDGLKIVVETRTPISSDEEFKTAMRSLSNYLKQTYNLLTDPSGKDISRSCYLCYDPQAILKESGDGFDVVKWTPLVEAQRPQVQTPIQRNNRPLMTYENPSDWERAEMAVQDIESQGIDITNGYSRWRDVGFALSELGESGRELFHRVSCFNPDYKPEETDVQFNRCLRGGGQGITLNTLFHIANEAGVRLRPSGHRTSETPLRGGQTSQAVNESSRPVQGSQEAQNRGIKPQQKEETVSFDWLMSPTTEAELIERESKLPEALRTGYVVRNLDTNSTQRLLLTSGKLTGIAGATGHGKSLLLMNLLLNVAKLNPDKRFVLLTYEETSDTILEYLLNIYLSDLNLTKNGVDLSNRMRLKEYFRGDKDSSNFKPEILNEFEFRKRLFFSTYIENGRILVKYTSAHSTELCQMIEFLSHQDNIGGVFVDYFQLINPNPSMRFPTRQEALKSICVELKDVANKTGLPVVLACQFNQEVLSPTDVQINRVGEAGDISRQVSELWGLWQMGKDIGRDLKKTDEEKVNRLTSDSQTMNLSDPFVKGMFVKVLKSRIVETGSEGLFKYRGLTGKIYPNDDNETGLSVEDWEIENKLDLNEDLPY